MTSKTTGLILALALFATPLGATAQQATVYRIGYLSTANPRPAPFFLAFEQRLRGLGYVEGQNISLEYRNAEDISIGSLTSPQNWSVST